MISPVNGDGDFPFPLAQGGLQAAHQGQIGGDTLHLPLVMQGLCQPFKIARWLVHVGFCHLDVIGAGGGVHHDIAHGGRFTDHLFVDLAFGRHVYHHVAHHLCLTAKPAAFGQAANGFVAFLNRIPV